MIETKNRCRIILALKTLIALGIRQWTNRIVICPATLAIDKSTRFKSRSPHDPIASQKQIIARVIDLSNSVNVKLNFRENDVNAGIKRDHY